MNNITVVVFSFNGHQDLLPYCLASIYRYFANCKEIVLVWDDYVRQRPVDFEQIKSDAGVPFRLVLQSEIRQWPQRIGEWGWIKQQLAKMLCYTYCDSDYVWIVDGDVLLTGNPQLFAPDGRPYLRFHQGVAVPQGYRSWIETYLELPIEWPWTWVGSTCLFETAECEKINQFLLHKHGRDLVECVHHAVTQHGHDDWPFSEFETYGTWIYHTCKDRHLITQRNWNYCGLENDLLLPIQIQWPNISRQDPPDLAGIYNRLTNNSPFAKIVR